MAAAAAPLISLGPGGWIAAGVITAGVLLMAKKNKNKNHPPLHDNGNKGNPNNKGPNGDQVFPFYYHKVKCKSKKDAFERALKDGFGNKPIPDGNHFHLSKMRGGKVFKFGNANYEW